MLLNARSSTHEAQQQIVTDLPIVPLMFGAEYAAMRDAVHGFEWIPDEIPRFRDLWKTPG